MALKFSVTQSSFDPASSIDILQATEALNSATSELNASEAFMDELNTVYDNLQTALDAVEKFGVNEEFITTFNSCGELSAALGIEYLSIASLESMSDKQLDRIDAKWESSIEGAMADIWKKIKDFFVGLWTKIKEYAQRFWDWVTGLFAKGNPEKAKATVAVTKAVDSAPAPVQAAAEKIVDAATPAAEKEAKAELKETVKAAPAPVQEKIVEAVKALPKSNVGANAPMTYKSAVEMAKSLPTLNAQIKQIAVLATQIIKDSKLGDAAYLKKLEDGANAEGGNLKADLDDVKLFIENCAVKAKKYLKDQYETAKKACQPGCGYEVFMNGDRCNVKISPPKAASNHKLGWNRKNLVEFTSTYSNIKPSDLDIGVATKGLDTLNQWIARFGNKGDVSHEFATLVKQLLSVVSNSYSDSMKAMIQATKICQATFDWATSKVAKMNASSTAIVDE